MNKVGIGVIGCGRMGQRYAQDVAFRIPKARLVAVCDTYIEAAKKTAILCGMDNWSIDYHQLLENNKIQAVIITTPTNTHVQIIKDVAESGKDIFCEKPIALTLEETDAVVDIIQKAGIKFQLGFMRRFDSGYIEAKQRIERGEIGDPVLFKAISRDPQAPPLDYAKPAVSGDIFMDLSIHDFDLARWLMGSEIKRVYAERGVLVHRELKPLDASDTCFANLLFENGAMGSIEGSRYAVYGYDVRAEIIGAKGAIIVGKYRYSPVLLLNKNFIGVTRDTVPWFLERFAQAYRDQLKDFVEAIYPDGEPKVTAHDGRAALKVVLAAIRSCREGKPIWLSSENAFGATRTSLVH